MQEFDFKVIHRRGVQHCNADVLTRVPCKQCGRCKGEEFEAVNESNDCVGVFSFLPFQSHSLQDIQRLHKEDDVIGPVYRCVQDDQTPPTVDASKAWSRESHLLLQNWPSLYIKHGVL